MIHKILETFGHVKYDESPLEHILHRQKQNRSALKRRRGE